MVGVKWRIFDHVALEEFRKGKSDSTYVHRSATLAAELVKHGWEQCQVMPHVINNKEALEKLMAIQTKLGWEGLVLKQPNMKWNNSGKRTLDMAKYKKLATYDLKVTDVEEGSGRLEGLIGALILSDATGRVVGKVGTGLSDNDRDYNKAYIGKVVEVKCERISPEGQLVQPVFLHLRDKEEVDVIKY